MKAHQSTDSTINALYYQNNSKYRITRKSEFNMLLLYSVNHRYQNRTKSLRDSLPRL